MVRLNVLLFITAVQVAPASVLLLLLLLSFSLLLLLLLLPPPPPPLMMNDTNGDHQVTVVGQCRGRFRYWMQLLSMLLHIYLNKTSITNTAIRQES